MQCRRRGSERWSYLHQSQRGAFEEKKRDMGRTERLTEKVKQMGIEVKELKADGEVRGGIATTRIARDEYLIPMRTNSELGEIIQRSPVHTDIYNDRAGQISTPDRYVAQPIVSKQPIKPKSVRPVE
jgi:hypothetical protein